MTSGLCLDYVVSLELIENSKRVPNLIQTWINCRGLDYVEYTLQRDKTLKKRLSGDEAPVPKILAVRGSLSLP